MSAEAFVVVDDRKLTPEELRKMLSDAFEAGCELGFKGCKEGAIAEVKKNHCGHHCECLIEDMIGPNVFAVMVGFDKYLKEKGGKT